MLAPIDQNTGNNGYQETANPILAHPGLRALLQQQIAIRDGVAPAGTPAPAMMPSNSAAGTTAPPITPAPQPTAQPQQATQPTANEARLAQLQNSKPGLENVYHKITSSDWGQNHPGLGKLAGIAGQIPATAADLAMSLKGLPVLGSSLSSIGQVMPGTTEQHNAKIGEAQGAVNADETNAEKEAQAGNLQSEIPLHEAQAKNMPLQQQLTAGEQGLKVDSNGLLVPQSQEEQSPGFKTQEELKQAQIYGLKNPWAKLPDKEPLGNTEAINAGLTDRYQVLHPGKPLPPEFTLPSNATKGDFERLDKLLSSTESAAGTQAQRETANQMRAQTYALAMQNSQNAQQARQVNEDAKKMKWVMGTNSGGETIAVPLSEAETMGLKNLAELPSTELKDMFNARHAVKLATQIGDPKAPETMGTLQLMDSLEKDGKLGVAASRINKFLTRGVGSEPGDDPRIAALLNKGDLFTTGIMLAHFGASAGRSPLMLQHFVQMADTGKMDGPTLKAGTKALVNYMQERAMESKGGNQPAQGGGQGGQPEVWTRGKDGKLVKQ
jgi:hypothetical protein